MNNKHTMHMVHTCKKNQIKGTDFRHVSTDWRDHWNRVKFTLKPVRTGMNVVFEK